MAAGGHREQTHTARRATGLGCRSLYTLAYELESVGEAHLFAVSRHELEDAYGELAL